MPEPVAEVGAVGSARSRLRSSIERVPVRRANGREVPLGRKAARTYAKLAASAHALFCEQGFQATTVTAIVERAGVGVGTFYQYFLDRADVLAALVGREVADALGSGRQQWAPGTGRDGLHAVVHDYVARYAETARFQAAWEEATHVDPSLAQLRRDLSRIYTDGLERRLGRAAAEGSARDDLEPTRMARAVTAMIDRYCYLTYVFDPPEHPEPPEEASRVLTELSVSALGLREARLERSLVSDTAPSDPPPPLPPLPTC